MAAKTKKTSEPAKKVTPEKSSTSVTESSSSTPVIAYEKNPHKILKAISIILISILTILIIAYLFRGLLVAATVNGESISRIVVVRTLEKQSGAMVLEGLITKKLILQEAQARNITISQADIDAEINRIAENLKKQGTTLEKAMEAQGMTREELDDEIRVQLALKKMTEGETKVTDKEIAEFIETNKASFPENTTEEEMKELARTQLEQQRSAEKSQALISELQQKARIMRLVGY